MNDIDNQNLKIDIFGIGPEYQELNSLIKNKNVSIKTDPINTENIWNSYDFFVLPSRKEGMSNVLLEAQYNNIFSIVSDCKTGNKEVIELTKNGICFKTGDYLDLKNCILRFYKAELKYNESQKIISENYSSDKALMILRRTLTI